MTSECERGTLVKVNDLGGKITGIEKHDFSCTHKIHLYTQGHHTN